jgi:hypothetical protein
MLRSTLTRYVLAAAFLSKVSFGQSAANCPVTLSPTTAIRSGSIALTIAGSLKVKQGSISLQGSDGPHICEATLQGNTLRCNLPDNLPLGHYTVAAQLDNKPYPACEMLSIVPAPNWTVTLAPFEPDATYETQTVWISSPAAKAARPLQTAMLKLRGSGFVMHPPEDNVILVNGDPLAHVIWDGCDTDHGAGDKNSPLTASTVHGKVASPESIELCGVPVPSSRELRISVKEGDVQTAIQSFHIYRWSALKVAAGAAAIAASLGLLVLWLVHLLTRRQSSDIPCNALQVLFLDPETNSYSLSKLQFYLWTAAALFGYAYLVISRMLVQGKVWPDVPATLPAIIAIGAGTSVGAQFVTSIRGPKGSGSETPSLGDFVTSGGVAAPERVQMLVWTVFGVVAFCLAVIRYGPGTINSLDSVPDGMLYLMGLSSAGYLGGKLARKPGPVINEISITPGESDEALANAAAPPPPGPPDLSQQLGQAQALLKSFTNVPPGGAQAAVDALSKAIAPVSRVKTVADAQDAITLLTTLLSHAETAAKASADVFVQPDAPPASARAAEIAEQAAAALQRLLAALSSGVAMALAPSPSAAFMRPSFTRFIELRGRSLSSEALIEIDGAELPFRMLREDGDGRRLPEIVVKEPDDPRLARILRLAIDPSQLEASDFAQYKKWFGTTDPTHRRLLTLINLDGQKSDISFTVPPSSAQSSVKTGQPVPAFTSQATQGA